MSSVGELRAERPAVREETQEFVSFPEDLALARRAALQDEAAWREIYDVTRDRLFALLSYYTGDREEALDLLQETYLGAIRTIERYRGDGSLTSWLAIIAIRRARDWRRKLVQWRRKHEALTAERLNDPPHAPDEHMRLKVRDSVAELKGNQRGAFLMREMEGMSFREIGQALGCDEATARVHHFRARETMRNLLGYDETAKSGTKRVRSESEAGGPAGTIREMRDKEARS
jgi:RNA polymerase sigma-70 factor (ECF subfamily)